MRQPHAFITDNLVASFQVIPNPCLHQDLAVEDTRKSHVFILADPKSLLIPNPCLHRDVGLDVALESPGTIPSFLVIPNPCLPQDLVLDLTVENPGTTLQVIPNPCMKQDLVLDLFLENPGKTPLFQVIPNPWELGMWGWIHFLRTSGQSFHSR